ncbi:LysR family transcriptional regulator [Pseudomonas sp. Pseu.R1]|uniref:LysR family transcriptional regulator n=1 Tax=Pseudomonas sp. Pseu.R1 TaxID=3379818 RepID=UPI003B926FE8
MNMLNCMRAFVCVAQTGSFTAAAAQMQTTTASISRSVANLESHLQTRLLQRNTRHVALTEAGSAYCLRCEDILASILLAESEMEAVHDKAVGVLKVHTMPGVGTSFLIDAMVNYQNKHPSVSFDFHLGSYLPNLIEEGFDLSVVVGTGLRDSANVAQQIGALSSTLCVSTQYQMRFNLPEIVDELDFHDCLMLNHSQHHRGNWLFYGPYGAESISPKRVPFQFNSADAMHAAITRGMGIGILPNHLALPGIQAGNLIRVLPRHDVPDLDVYAVYPSRRYVSAKVRTWIDHLRNDLLNVRAVQDCKMKNVEMRARVSLG